MAGTELAQQALNLIDRKYVRDTATFRALPHERNGIVFKEIILACVRVEHAHYVSYLCACGAGRGSSRIHNSTSIGFTSFRKYGLHLGMIQRFR